MGRSAKWIDSRPGDSVEDVARRALEARLERLWHFLERAVSQPPSETENVHQLRVFARRTAAAMEIFADWLPRRRSRWIGKRLKRVRKAAGEARDLDVLHLRWSKRLRDIPEAQLGLLLEQVKRRRRKAQWPIEDVYYKLLRNKFEHRATKFVKRVRLRREDDSQCDGRISCLARVALGRLVVPYLQAARGEMSDVEALHAFRINSKEVRYAMEIFAGAFDPAFRHELYPIVEALQDRLGAINDHVTAETYLTAWKAETDSPAVEQAIAAGIEREQQWFEQARQGFSEWWSDERRELLASQFARYVQLDETPTPPEPHGSA